ncbi:hypothetical protein [Streptomyces sp. NPDC005141]
MTATIDGLLDATRGVAPGSAPGNAVNGTGEFAPCETIASAPTADVVEGTTLHLLTLAWAEGLCGTAEVYGAPCEQACVPSTARPYRIDGVVLRLRPLTLNSPLPSSAALLLEHKHLRSRVAAAYFADERAAASSPMSAALLASETWCRGGTGPVGNEVPLAVLARSGRTTVFADAWTARRELLDTPARNYGDSRLSMRPRGVFTAQIAQFQCQLASLTYAGLPSSPAVRILADAGVVELPPAGYLPVDPAGDLCRQVASLLGPGVDLRFVPVPADQVPHEVEEVQHRDRISLLAGLDDPSAKPGVDVLVPDGRITTSPQVTGRGGPLQMRLTRGEQSATFSGIARFPARHAEGFALATAGFCTVDTNEWGVEFVDTLAKAVLGHANVSVPDPAENVLRPDHLRRLSAEAGQFAAESSGLPTVFFSEDEFDAEEGRPIAVRAALSCDRDLWWLKSGETALVTAQFDLFAPYRDEDGNGPAAALFELFGRMELSGTAAETGSVRRLRFTGQLGVDQVQGQGSARPLRSLNATVMLSEQPDGRLFTIHLGRGRPTKLELKDDGSLVLALPDDVLTARFIQDWSVFDQGSPLRQLGEASLGLLRGAYTTHTEFYERARADLFGAAGSATAGPVLTATRDWVAFRRRSVEPPPMAAPPAPSGVVAWVAGADNDQMAREWAERLHQGEADELPWKRVRTVLFDPGTARAHTSPDELRRSYANTGAPMAIHHVGFGAAGPMQNGKERAVAIADALPPAAVMDPEADVAQVVTVPAGLLEPDSDGGVFLLAYPAQRRTALLQVVGLTDEHGQPNRDFTEAIRALDVDRVDSMGTVLGTIRVEGGHAEPQSFDEAQAGTDRAVRAGHVFEPTPVLWLDGEWAAQDPEAAELLRSVVDQFLAGITLQADPQPLSLRRAEEAPVGSGERQAMLILHCARREG